MNTTRSFSSFLIYCSVTVTIMAYFYPDMYILGINDIFIKNEMWYLVIIQFFVGTLLHQGIMHLLFNSIFIFYFGNILEALIGKKKFIIFYIFSAIFIGSLLLINIKGNTIGISGFAMSLLAYYTLELKSRNNIEYKGGITAIIINIGIGFVPGISLAGHFYGAVAGVIFYFLNKEIFRKKMVGIVEM